jgi:hypothetical protein
VHAVRRDGINNSSRANVVHIPANKLKQLRDDSAARRVNVPSMPLPAVIV